MTPLIITLDGPSGSGKSTVAIRLALHFGLPCLDTGAMYRALALKCLEKKVNLEEETDIVRLARTLRFDFGFEGIKPWAAVKEGEDVFKRLGKEIRTPEVSMAASKVAKLPEVRRVLVAQQQAIGRAKGAVVEGRDAGTVIFPEANLKFFMTASSEERAKRRHAELLETLGDKAQSFHDVLKEMRARDEQDEKRSASPSKPAPDAVIVDTSGLQLDAVVSYLIQKVEERRR